MNNLNIKLIIVMLFIKVWALLKNLLKNLGIIIEVKIIIKIFNFKDSMNKNDDIEFVWNCFINKYNLIWI